MTANDRDAGQLSQDGLVASLCDQLGKYQAGHDRCQWALADGRGDLGVATELAGTIHGLRIALCLAMGWDPAREADKEGLADQLWQRSAAYQRYADADAEG